MTQTEYQEALEDLLYEYHTVKWYEDIDEDYEQKIAALTLERGVSV